MKNLRHTLWGVLSLLLALMAGACAGNSTTRVSIPQPAQPQLMGVLDARLAAAVTKAHTEPFAWGRDYDPALPQAATQVQDRALRIAHSGAPLGYATYAFRLPAYPGPAKLTVGGNYSSYTPDEIASGVWMNRATVWVGLANWQSGRWDWHLLDHRQQLALPTLQPYFKADGTLLATVASSNFDAWVLWLRIGDSPWMEETLPNSGLSALPLLAVHPDGTPRVVLQDGDGLKLLHRSVGGSWSAEVLDADYSWSIGGFEVDATGQVHVIATAEYLISEVPRIRQTDVCHFTPQANPAREVIYSKTEQLMGMENPGSVPRWSWEQLTAPSPQRLAVASNFDGARLGVRRSSVWEFIHTDVFSPQFAADGSLRALDEYGGAGGDANHLLFSMENADGSWTTEEVNADAYGSRQDSVLLPHGSSWAVLARRWGEGITLFTPATGGWQAEPLTIPDREPYRPNAARSARFCADGRLRFTDEMYSYTRTGWGTLSDTLIELPRQAIYATAYDASGKLHVVTASTDSSWGLGYSREP